MTGEPRWSRGPSATPGMEVVYTGLHQTPEQIVDTVVQEDADAVGLSVLSGAHMTLFARLAELLAERYIDDVVVFGGGIIPEEDIPELERLGGRPHLHPRRHHHRDRRLGARERRRARTATRLSPATGRGQLLHVAAAGGHVTGCAAYEPR